MRRAAIARWCRALPAACLAAGLASGWSAGAAADPGAALQGPGPLRLAPPWPQEAALGGIDGTAVTFDSHSPFSLADVGRGPALDPPTVARATLFLPPAASAQAPVPAVIMLHGASGVLTEREMTYGRQFAAMGVAALVVDVFGARRDRGTGFTARLLNITEAMVLADAYAGLRYLDRLPEVDGARVVLIGFSYGGMATTYAAYAQVAETFAPGGERFVGHVAYYAPCIAEFEDGRATGAPLLMLYGGKDAIVDPDRCAAMAEALEAGGAEVETIVYPEAVHQWDGRFGAPRMIGRNLKGCGFHVARDGTVSDSFLPITMSDPFTRKLILALCVAKDGYMIGRDDAVRDRSNADLARFLEKVFAGTAP
jgi:dienelactone hydrolase